VVAAGREDRRVAAPGIQGDTDDGPLLAVELDRVERIPRCGRDGEALGLHRLGLRAAAAAQAESARFDEEISERAEHDACDDHDADDLAGRLPAGDQVFELRAAGLVADRAGVGYVVTDYRNRHAVTGDA